MTTRSKPVAGHEYFWKSQRCTVLSMTEFSATVRWSDGSEGDVSLDELLPLGLATVVLPQPPDPRTDASEQPEPPQAPTPVVKPQKALARLLGDLGTIDGHAPTWLDNHRDDVLAVVSESGVTETARQLGIPKQTIYDWRHRREHPQPKLNAAKKNPADGARPPKAPTSPGPEQDINYWKGKYEGMVECLRMVTGRDAP